MKKIENILNGTETFICKKITSDNQQYEKAISSVINSSNGFFWANK